VAVWRCTACAAARVCGCTAQLASETIQSSALSLEGIHHVHRCDGLSASVLGVGHGISDDVLEEDLEHATGLFVNQTADSLDTSSTGETADGWLGDALDVVTKNLAMALGTALAKSFASFAAASHCCTESGGVRELRRGERWCREKGWMTMKAKEQRLNRRPKQY
jgi:hypothetical protein